MTSDNICHIKSDCGKTHRMRAKTLLPQLSYLCDTSISSKRSPHYRRKAGARPTTTPVQPEHRPPEQLPDPWLFDTEKLLAELDRCRELVLLIPATTHATHFAINNAITSIWNLREHLRYLLLLHGEGQRAWQKRANETQRKEARMAASSASGKRRRGADNARA